MTRTPTLALLGCFLIGGCQEVTNPLQQKSEYIECEIAQMENSISETLVEIADDFDLYFVADDRDTTDGIYLAQMSNKIGMISAHGRNRNLELIRGINPFISNEQSDIDHLDDAMEAARARLSEIC